MQHLLQNGKQVLKTHRATLRIQTQKYVAGKQKCQQNYTKLRKTNKKTTTHGQPATPVTEQTIKTWNASYNENFPKTH